MRLPFLRRFVLVTIGTAAAAALALGATPGGQPRPATAATACADPSGGPPAIRVGIGQTVTTSIPAATVARQYVCPLGSSGGTDVLDVRASTTGGQDFVLCISGIADTSNLSATTYGRSSHAVGSTIQRVAFSSPGDPEYRIDEASLVPTASSALATFGPGCGIQALASRLFGTPQAYTLTVSYLPSTPRAPSNGFAFLTTHLPKANPSPSTPGSGEPSIAVDRLHGDRVYVSGPVGVPSGAACALDISNPSVPPTGCNGVNFWFSTDGGQSFRFCNASLPNGGGDSHVAVDTSGSIYSADLAASNVDVQKLPSTPSGPSTPTAGASCGFTTVTPTAPQADRQWLATYLPDPSQGTGAARVYLSYHTLTDNLPWECTSVQGGTVFLPCTPMVTSGPAFTDGLGNTINGNQVFDSGGTIYSIFGTSTVADNATHQGSGPIHNLYVAVSADGVTFQVYPIVQTTPPGMPGTQSLAQNFPVIAVDRSDNLYAVWSQGPASGGPTAIFLSSSTDHGQHWSAPVQVSSPDLGSNVLPWIVAGTDGRVDIVWVGTTARSASDPTANWYEYMAQSLDAHDAHPVFTQTVVSPQPIRYGDYCSLGLACTFGGDDGRILLDFTSVDIDSHCMANIAYANAGPDTETVGFGFDPYTDYAKQVAGSSLCANASAPVTPSAPSGGQEAAGIVSTLPNTTGGAAPSVTLLAIAALGGVVALGRRRS